MNENAQAAINAAGGAIAQRRTKSDEIEDALMNLSQTIDCLQGLVSGFAGDPRSDDKHSVSTAGVPVARPIGDIIRSMPETLNYSSERLDSIRQKLFDLFG